MRSIQRGTDMTRMILHRLLRLRRNTAGTNMFEAAIITPLLLLLTFAIIDFGALFYVNLALQNGVAQASRFGVTGNVSGGMDRVQSIRAAMREATPTLTLDDGAFEFHHMAAGGASWTGGTGGPNDVERITVNYTWDIMTPVIRPFFPGGHVQFQVRSIMRNEGRFE